MNTATKQQPILTEMTIGISDLSIVSQIKAMLKLIPGIDTIRVKPAAKGDNTITQALARKIAKAEKAFAEGKTMQFESVAELDKYLDTI